MASKLSDIPPNATWFRFSGRASFYSAPGFPQLRRWLPCDKRILRKTLDFMESGATVIFYRLTFSPDPFDKTSSPCVMHFVEVQGPGALQGGVRFLPSWLGYTRSAQEQQLQQSSIFYISKVQ